MKTFIRQLVAASAVCQALLGGAALAQSSPEMSLTRFDCGTPAAPILVSQRFSDTYAFGDLRLQFVFSCYLIRHGDQYLIWDTGHSMSAGAVAPKRSLVEQLAQLNLQPDQITHVGISHYHPDHTGQAGSFPKATLLIGRAATLASLDRFKKIEGNLKALVVMQHDARDVAKLPAFPASAK